MKDTTHTKIRAVLAAGTPSGIDIAYLLALRGYSQRRLARELEVGAATVYGTIHGHDTSSYVAYRIAELLDTTTEKLWPGRYTHPPRRNSRRQAA